MYQDLVDEMEVERYVRLSPPYTQQQQDFDRLLELLSDVFPKVPEYERRKGL